MRRLSLIATSVVILLTLLAPAALAAEPVTSTGSVAVTVNGALDVPSGTSLDVAVVVDGTATIYGDTDTVVVVEGTATIAGATVEHLVVVSGRADLLNGTTVTGTVTTVDGSVTTAGGAAITGRWTSPEADLAAFMLLLIPLMLAFTVGLAIATVVAALLVAAFGARQVRDVESLISDRPGHVLVAGVAGTIGLPIVAGLLILTVIGAPIGFAMLFGILPVLAFLAWIVAAIWIGDWIIARSSGQREPGRPYRAAVVGVIVLSVASLLPFVSAIATLFGMGGLLLAAWRVLRPEQPAQPVQGQPVGPMWTAPTAG